MKKVKPARKRNLRKTTPLHMLTISNVPNDVLEAIDDLAASQGRSRSSFIRRALHHIVLGYGAKAA